jgi:hypothetical protein
MLLLCIVKFGPTAEICAKTPKFETPFSLFSRTHARGLLMAHSTSFFHPIFNRVNEASLRSPDKYLAKKSRSSFYRCPTTERSKYVYEKYHTYYAPIWMVIFGIIVVFQLYETWSATHYNTYLLLLALPCGLQPILVPSAFFNSPDANRPFFGEICDQGEYLAGNLHIHWKLLVHALFLLSSESI